MAAITANTDFTVLPNGDDLRVAYATGATAGDVAIDSTFGVAAGTILQQVVAVTLSGVLVKSAKDLSSEFTSPVAAANTINNTGGTSTAGAIVQVLFRKYSLRELQH